MNNPFDELTKNLAQAVTRRAARTQFARLLSIALAVSTLLAFVTRVHAQGGIPLWTNRYDGQGNGNDQATAIAADGSGDLFVTGSSWNGMTYDYATIKYSGTGVPLWTNRYHGPGNGDDYPAAVVVDKSGNLFVTGHSYGLNGYYDYATVAYSGGGVPLWTNHYDGPGNGNDQTTAIAADGSGNVLVTGLSQRTNNYEDYATIKYSGAGVPLWTNRYNGPADSMDVASAVAVDASGNVVVTGTSHGGSSYQDYLTIKYSPAGVPLWTNRYNGPANDADFAVAVAVDSSGNVFTTGYSWSGSAYGYGYATIKYSASGVTLWTRRYEAPGDGDDRATAIVVDGGGNVIVTGYSAGSSNSDAYATIKYSGAGLPLWTNRYNAVAGSDAAIAVDGGGQVFVTGYGFATVAYSGAGSPLWTNRYDMSPYHLDFASAVRVDGNGDVIVTGSSLDDTWDYVTIKYSVAALSPIPLTYQRLANQFVLSWTNSAFSLQSAPTSSGSFTNIPGATSPHTNASSRPQQYFRLKGN